MRFISECKKQKILIFLFILPLAVDLLNGFLKGSDGEGESPVGIIYRGAVMLYSIRSLPNFKYRNLLFLIYCCGAVCSIIHILGGSSSFSISQFFKITYGYFILSILWSLRYKIDVDTLVRYCIFYGVGASASIIICNALGIGYSSYVEGTFGSKGLFIAMNSIGLTMQLTNVLALCWYAMSGKRFFIIASLIISCGGCLTGSMAGFLGTAIIFIAYFLCIWFPIVVKEKKQKNNLKRQRIEILCIFTIVILFVVGKIISLIIEDPYLSGKYQDIWANISEVSGRSNLINAGLSFIENQSVVGWLFGSGDIFYYYVGKYGIYENMIKSVEVDYLDLLGYYGIFMTFLLLFLPLKSLCNIIKMYKKNKSFLSYWILIGFFVFWGYALYGGHAFTSPLSLTYYMVYVFITELLIISKGKNEFVVFH